MEIDKLAIITRKLDDVAGEVELLDVRFVIGNVTYEWDDGGLYVCGDE